MSTKVLIVDESIRGISKAVLTLSGIEADIIILDDIAAAEAELFTKRVMKLRSNLHSLDDVAPIITRVPKYDVQRGGSLGKGGKTRYPNRRKL